MKRRIQALFLIIVLVLSLASNAFAAKVSAPADGSEDLSAQGIHLVGERKKDVTTVKVHLSGAEGVTNGRFVVTYNAKAVELLRAEPGDPNWISSINDLTAGEVAFAWVASDLSGDADLMLTLYFTNLDQQDQVYTVEAEELYVSGTSVELDAMEDSLTVLGTNRPIDPDRPIVTPPVQPVEPDDKGDGDETDVLYNPFIDIDDHWAEEDILKAYHAGLVNGTSANTFSPNGKVTRAMFVTLLYRLNGEPTVTGKMPFTDVAEGKYYTDAVLWAYTNEVVNGTSATTFSPDDFVTRQEMVAMLYRYAKNNGMDVSDSVSLNDYSDASSVASWASTAMQWAAADGIVKGANGALNPRNNTTRAEAAAILVRFAGI